jgi:hypothetical protein
VPLRAHISRSSVSSGCQFFVACRTSSAQHQADCENLTEQYVEITEQQKSIVLMHLTRIKHAAVAK